MLLDCPVCARSYHVSRAEIGAEGRTVICPRCDAHWFAYGDGTITGSDLHTTSYSAGPAVTPIDDAVALATPSLWRRMRPAALAVACIALAMGVIGAREAIVRTLPRLAGLYAQAGLRVNVRGLEIAALAPRRPDATALEVSGMIRNVARRRVSVPRLVYEVRDATGAPLLTWTEHAPAQSLGAGRSASFVSTPHQLPPEGRSLLVRFEDAEAAPTVRLARHLN